MFTLFNGILGRAFLVCGGLSITFRGPRRTHLSTAKFRER
jgi:hypothetical protein